MIFGGVKSTGTGDSGGGGGSGATNSMGGGGGGGFRSVILFCAISCDAARHTASNRIIFFMVFSFSKDTVSKIIHKKSPPLLAGGLSSWFWVNNLLQI